MRCIVSILTLLGLAATCTRQAAAQIFTDNLSSGANWTIVQDADTSFEFGYDYSQKGVPPAPSGPGDTIGLKFEVNNAAPAAVAQIVAFNANAAYAGQYTLRADVWINWALVGGTVGTGTTEFAGLSVGHDGLGVGPFGASFLFDGDGDTTADYRFYKNLTEQAPASGQYATGTTTGANGNANPVYAAAFPAINVATAVPSQGQTGMTPVGAGGFQWMTVNMEVDANAVGPAGVTPDPGYVRVSMRSASSGNVVAVGTIDNSNGGAVVNMTGSIALLMSDIFSSVTTNPAFSFALFDNVQVLAGLVPLATPPNGRYDADQDVDGDDLLVWQRGQSPNPLSATDLAAWKNNYGAGGAIAASAPLPEPSAVMLIGLAGCPLCRRRR